MKLRIACAALVLTLFVTAVAMLMVGPLVRVLYAGAPDASTIHWKSTFWTLTGLFMLVSAVGTFAFLYVLFGLPLSRAEAAVEEIVDAYTDVDVHGGGVLTRIDASLRRLATALREESQKNAQQLASLKASNVERVRLQAQLVAADRLATVGKLASGVAHEVGNPLAGILGYLSVIRLRDSGVSEVADSIETEVHRIDGIVRGLLELGRPSRGKAQALDVCPLLANCVRLLAAGSQFQDVRISIEAPPALWLLAEEGPLSQVLVNLLLNAAQAMDWRGEIVLHAYERETRGCIAVLDAGPGLKADVLPRLFELFFTTKPAGQGSGLGLAVSQHLLAQFDGTLEAANREGGGAAFTLTLPRP